MIDEIRGLVEPVLYLDRINQPIKRVGRFIYQAESDKPIIECDSFEMAKAVAYLLEMHYLHSDFTRDAMTQLGESESED